MGVNNNQTQDKRENSWKRKRFSEIPVVETYLKILEGYLLVVVSMSPMPPPEDSFKVKLKARHYASVCFF